MRLGSKYFRTSGSAQFQPLATGGTKQYDNIAYLYPHGCTWRTLRIKYANRCSGVGFLRRTKTLNNKKGTRIRFQLLSLLCVDVRTPHNILIFVYFFFFSVCVRCKAVNGFPNGAAVQGSALSCTGFRVSIVLLWYLPRLRRSNFETCATKPENATRPNV